MSESALPHSPTLGALLPTGALQRGTVVGIAGRCGVASLTFRLLAEMLEGDHWAAAVSWPELGAEAALELGVPLDHLTLIPEPGPKWLDVVGALIDSVDVIVLRPSGRVNVSVARRIAVRAHERGCVVVVTLFGSSTWPESFDARFVTTSTNWVGLGRGFGTVSQRFLDVEVQGRRVPNTRRVQLVLPTANGDAAQISGAADSASDDGNGFAITA